MLVDWFYGEDLLTLQSFSNNGSSLRIETQLDGIGVTSLAFLSLFVDDANKLPDFPNCVEILRDFGVIIIPTPLTTLTLQL